MTANERARLQGLVEEMREEGYEKWADELAACLAAEGEDRIRGDGYRCPDCGNDVYVCGGIHVSRVDSQASPEWEP